MAFTLGAIKTNKTTAAKKKDLPILPGDKELAEMVDEVIKQSDQEKAAKAGKEALQAVFKEKARPFIFELNHAKSTITGTIVALGTDGTELQIALKDAYGTLTDLTEVEQIIGKAKAAQFFEETFEIKLSSKAIPKDSQQAFIDAVVAVAQEFNCTDAVSASTSFKPKGTFAIARHTDLTTEENLMLEGINGGKGLTTMSVAPARGRK